MSEAGHRARVTMPIMEFDHTWALIDLGRFEDGSAVHPDRL